MQSNNVTVTSLLIDLLIVINYHTVLSTLLSVRNRHVIHIKFNSLYHQGACGLKSMVCDNVSIQT